MKVAWIAGLLRDLLDDQSVRQRVVGHLERGREAHVDLVLRRADLVVDVLDRDAHLLERADGLLAQLARRVHRRHREVAALVERLRALVVLEQEVLELRADVERVEAHLLHPVERAAQHVARVALVWLAVRRDDVADHPADLGLAFPPGHHPVRARVGDGDHVRLLDRVEARDRRAVEAHAVVERGRDLARRDREALEVPFEVGEPEEQELDSVRLHLLERVLAGLLAGRCPVLRLDLLRHANASLNAKSPGRRSPEASLPHQRSERSRVQVDAGSSSSSGSRPWWPIARA